VANLLLVSRRRTPTELGFRAGPVAGGRSRGRYCWLESLDPFGIAGWSASAWLAYGAGDYSRPTLLWRTARIHELQSSGRFAFTLIHSSPSRLASALIFDGPGADNARPKVSNALRVGGDRSAQAKSASVLEASLVVKWRWR